MGYGTFCSDVQKSITQHKKGAGLKGEYVDISENVRGELQKGKDKLRLVHNVGVKDAHKKMNK